MFPYIFIHIYIFFLYRYKDDFSPICKKCECLTCQNHTRAYLHHLHHTKEMLGLILLMMYVFINYNLINFVHTLLCRI